MKQRIISLLLVLVMLVGMLPVGSYATGAEITPAANSTSVDFSVQTDLDSYQVGDTVTATAVIGQHEGIEGLTLQMTYDTEKLTLVSAEYGTAITAGMGDFNAANLKMAYTNPTVGYTGEGGTLFTATFTAKAEGSAEFGITVEEMYDITDGDVTANITGKTIAIEAGEETDPPVESGSVTVCSTVTGLTFQDEEGSQVLAASAVSGGYTAYTLNVEPGTYTYAAEGYGTGMLKLSGGEEIYLRHVAYALAETAAATFKVRVVNTEDTELVYTSTESDTKVNLLVPAYDYGLRYQFYFEPTNDRYASFHGNLWVPVGASEFEGFKTSRYNLSDSRSYIMSNKVTVTFQIPEGADLKVQQLVKFYRQLNEFDVTYIKTEGGYDYYESVVANGGGDLQYEVKKDGYMKVVGNFSASAGTIVVELPEYGPEHTNTNYENSLLTNGNASKFIELEVGDSFDMWFTRAWQAVADISANSYIDPDRHFYILEGDSVTVDEYGVVRAVKEGTTVVAMTYDAMQAGGIYYGAVDPDKVAVFVFDVGGSNKSLDIGFNHSDLQTFYIARTLTIDGVEGVVESDSYPYTFTPTTTGSEAIEVSVSTVYGYPTPEMSQWETYTANEDGSYTIDLHAGRNIVRVRSGEAEQYYVLNAIASDVTVSNVTNPGEPIAAGDSVKIAYTGVITPQPKLGAIYNPGFGGTVYLEGTLSSDAEGIEDTTIKGGATQYGISAMSNIVFTPANAGKATVKGVRIHLGSFGSAPSAHWKLGLQSGGGSYDGGLAPESTAYYCYFPDVTFDVKESDIPQRVAEILELFNAIGQVELTDECKARINAARFAYDSAVEQVRNSITAEQLLILTDAEAVYQKLLDDHVTATIETREIDGVDYYVITNGDELLWFSRLVNGLVEGHELTADKTARESVNAILDNDIVLNEDLLDANYQLNVRTTALNKWLPIGGRQWKQGWMTISAQFRGIFDGNGHTISGLYYTTNSEYGYHSFFGNTSAGATVKDLKLVDSYVNGNAGVAAGSGITLENVSYEGRVTGTGSVAGLVLVNTNPMDNCHFVGVVETSGCLVGGLVGTNTSTITNCTFNGKIISTATEAQHNTGAGGVAYTNNGTIRNCIVEGTITAPVCAAGGIVGGYSWQNHGTIDTCAAICDVSGSVAAGISASPETPEIHSCFSYGTLTGETVYGTAKAFIANSPSVYWDSVTATEVENSRPMTNEQLANGNAAYVLGITWGQKIGTDPFPVFSDGTNQVFRVGSEYKNASAQVLDALVAGIGTVALDGSENCFAKTTEAMQCYNILSDEEKAAVTSAEELMAKQKAYDDVVTALIAKIEAIKPVDSSDECLARIDAAQADYNAYVERGGDIELVTNHSFIEEAYADHALWVRHDAEYAVEVTINKTTIDGKEFYEITNPGQFAWFGKLVNGALAKTPQNREANAILKNDIVFNENLLETILDEEGNLVAEKLEGLNHWESIGVSYTGFAGILDGNGYAVKGMLIINTEDSYGYCGLVGDNWGTVRNVTVTDSYINGGTDTVGAVAGRINNAVVENVAVTNTIVDGRNRLGGIVGSVQGFGTVRNSYSFATIQGTGTAGGIAGDLNYGNAENCYFGGTFAQESYGGVASDMYSATVTNCYYPEGLELSRPGGTYRNVTVNGGGTYTAEQLSSGWLAWSLGSAFGQEIGVDAYPVLDGSKRVFFVNDTYSNASAETAIALIDAIGTVGLEGSDSCFTNTVIAGDCYELLSEEEKANVINVQLLKDAQTDYEAVVTSIMDEIKTFTPLTTKNYTVYETSAIATMLENYTIRGGDLARVTNYADYTQALEVYPSIAHQLIEDTMTTTVIDGVEYYRITNVDQLQWYTWLLDGSLLTGTERNRYANAILENDLVVNENLLASMSGFTPPEGTVELENQVGLRGIFDGNGHTISGVYSSALGLFSVNNGGQLKNLTLTDSFVGSSNSVAMGIATAVYGNSLVENCHFEGKLVGTSISGISGEVSPNSVIRNCSVKAELVSYATTINHRIGGISGYANGPIENCYFQGTIDLTNTSESARYIGGIAGRTFDETSVKNCYAVCEIIGERTYTGIIASQNLGTYENNYYLTTGDYKAVGTEGYASEDIEGIAPKTAEEFANGTVTKLLGKPYVQRVGTDPYPALTGNLPTVRFTLELTTDSYKAGDTVTANLYISGCESVNTLGYSLTYNASDMILRSAQAGECFTSARSEDDKNTGAVVRVLFVSPETQITAGEDGRILVDTLTFTMLDDALTQFGFAAIEGDGDFAEAAALAYDGGVSLNVTTEVSYETTAAENEAAAGNVDDLIAAIGEPVYEYADEIIAAREAYESLTEEQKELVENLEELESAEARYSLWSKGDVNLDGIINAQDLSIMLSAYGSDEASCNINLTDLVNSADLSILLSNYGARLEA